MPHSRATRVLRGAAAAAVATFVALFSHVAGGGQPPSWLGVVAPLIIATMICTLLAGRTLNLARLSIGVGLSQVLFHTIFSFATGGAPATGSAHHGTAMTMPMPSAPHTGHDLAMWIGHGVAAIITIAALYFAERLISAVLGLARLITAWLRRIILPALPVTHSRVTRHIPAWQTTGHLPLGVYPRAVRRRGPPQLLAV